MTLWRNAAAQAKAIDKVNASIAAGGESYLRYRQIEMLPMIPDGLGRARLVTISGGGGWRRGERSDEPDRERDPDRARRRATGDEGGSPGSLGTKGAPVGR
jgi:hypothetical protein